MLDQTNFSMIQSQNRTEHEQKDVKTLLNTFAESVVGDQQSQKFSLDNNFVPKTKMKQRKITAVLKLKPEIY